MERKKVVILEEDIMGKNNEVLYEANKPYKVFYSEFIQSSAKHIMTLGRIEVNFRVEYLPIEGAE